MSLPISSLSGVPRPSGVEPLRTTSESSKPGEFRSLLEGAVEHVEASRTQANTAVEQFLSGETQELHTTILATQKADLELSLFLQARNKVVSAYQEIMRMQV